MTPETQVGTLLTSLALRLDNETGEEVAGFLAAGEWGVGFEWLCDHVHEIELPLTINELDQFETIGERLVRVSPFPDRGVWSMLRSDNPRLA